MTDTKTIRILLAWNAMLSCGVLLLTLALGNAYFGVFRPRGIKTERIESPEFAVIRDGQAYGGFFADPDGVLLTVRTNKENSIDLIAMPTHLSLALSSGTRNEVYLSASEHSASAKVSNKTGPVIDLSASDDLSALTVKDGEATSSLFPASINVSGGGGDSVSITGYVPAEGTKTSYGPNITLNHHKGPGDSPYATMEIFEGNARFELGTLFANRKGKSSDQGWIVEWKPKSIASMRWLDPATQDIVFEAPPK